MDFQIGKDAEPIPGYRLIRAIGRGGFGEVWEAEAPGGIRKAIKFVFGTVENLSRSSSADQELKSLSRVKGVRHPFLLSLERFDLVERHLVIVTELADMDLLARFRECREQGLLGIPREELLRYMEETAEVLDLMNQTHDLQHLDIKPQNLCLLHNHVKVADFGLVKDLTGLMTSMTGGMTPRYAAPEIFRGLVTRFSDQYSLAVLYQEMLTGQLIFNASSPHEMMRLHTEGVPNLDSLPPLDQSVVGRALAKDPNQRYPSCRSFVGDLRAANRPQAGPSLPATPEKLPLAAPTLIMARPGGPSTGPNPPVVEASETVGDGVLVPALVVGVGGFGLEVLRRFHQVLQTRTVGPARLPHLQLLGIDTDPESVSQVVQGSAGEGLPRDNVLAARLARMTRYLRPVDPLPPLERWISSKMIARIPKNLLTGGCRALGRLALVDNYRAIRKRLERALEQIIALDALHTATRESGLTMRSNWPRIFVVASLGGGTGSGMFIDLACILRAILLRRGYGRAEVVGLFLPSADRADSALSRANACAAMVELHHFAAGAPFLAEYERSALPIENKGPAFSRTVLVATLAGKDADSGAAATAGEYLYWNLLTPLGREADQARVFEPATQAAAAPAAPLLFKTAGLRVLASPCRRWFQYGVRRLSGELLHRWTAQSRPDLRASIREEVGPALHARGPNPQAILAAFQEECSRKMGKRLEDLIAGWLEPVAERQAVGVLDVESLKQALQQVDRFLGVPGEEGSLQPAPVPALVRQVGEQLGLHHAGILADLILQYLERPGARLSGAVEALQQAMALLERAPQVQDAHAKELGFRVEHLSAALRAGLAEQAFDAGKRRYRSASAPPLEELARTLVEYPKLHGEHILLLRVRALHLGLRSSLSDLLREMRTSRDLLDALRGSLEEPDEALASLPADSVPVFDGCSADELIHRTLQSLTSDDWSGLDQSIQAALQSNRDGPDSVKTALLSKEGLSRLRQVIVREAEHFLAERLPMLTDPLEFFLAQHPQEQSLAGALRNAFETALPVLGGLCSRPDRELSLLMAPDSGAAERFKQAVDLALPETTLVMGTGQDEIVVYRESGLTFEELEQQGLICVESYDRACSSEQFTPHTRVDVAWRKPQRG